MLSVVATVATLRLVKLRDPTSRMMHWMIGSSDSSLSFASKVDALLWKTPDPPTSRSRPFKDGAADTF